MLSPFVRILQRYLYIGALASVYYFLRYRCYVSPQSRVQLSSNISIGQGTVIKPFAILQTHTGDLRIGKNCAISSFNHLSAGEANLLLGDHVRIGPNTTIVASSRNFRDRSRRIAQQGFSHQGVQIGDDVLIGAGVVILDGVEIGQGAVIGAGSVVTSSVEPYVVVAGSPAQPLGARS